MIVVTKKSKADDGFARYQVTLAAREAPPKPPRHPLVELGEGLRPIEYARLILTKQGELTTYHGNPWLKDTYATPSTIMREANLILKRNGLPQIGGPGEWSV